jgi:hypothetical protein
LLSPALFIMKALPSGVRSHYNVANGCTRNFMEFWPK